MNSSIWDHGRPSFPTIPRLVNPMANHKSTPLEQSAKIALVHQLARAEELLRRDPDNRDLAELRDLLVAQSAKTSATKAASVAALARQALDVTETLRRATRLRWRSR
jgi:hypothetical protein